MNLVILHGRLGKDPELKYTSNSTAVCNLSLATDETYKDKDGNKHDKTEWHRLVAWGRQAEVMAEYLKKGSEVVVTGKIETRSWEKDGKKNYTTEVRVSTFEFCGRSKTEGPPEDNQPF